MQLLSKVFSVKMVYRQLITIILSIYKNFSLRLGYMRYSNPEMEDYAWAVPMWVLDCDYVPSGKQRVVDSFHEHFELNRWEAYEFAQIPLNAQTGEMKIITTGDEATFAVPEMTTWEDVQ